MNNESKKIKSFTDLNTWKKAHELVVNVYKETKKFPKEEIFGLVSQMRRCAVSISSNIAEGFSRLSYKDKAHFYSISQGSLTELQNQILIAKDVGFMDKKIFNTFAEETVVVHKLLSGLIKSSKNIHNS